MLFRYANGAVDANPNGSLRDIAGVINAAGNVAGLMPHPETAVEAVLGSDDGLGIIRSFVESAAERGRDAPPAWSAADDARGPPRPASSMRSRSTAGSA